MTHPGITFALVLGVALGTAIYYYFKSDNSDQSYQYDHSSHRSTDDQQSNSSSVWDSENEQAPRSNNSSRRRRRNSKSSTKSIRQCSICLDNLDFSKTTDIDCGHTFHERCITTWFHTSKTCPNCRSYI